MNLLRHILPAALLVLASVPTPGRGCAALCAGMGPAAAHTASFAAPLHDCCRVRAESPRPATPARLLEKAPRSVDAAAAPREADDLRPAPRAGAPQGRPGSPRPPGPPLYTLLATLLI